MPDEWNSVPRGVFETASLMWGLTLTQASIMSGIGLVLLIGIMLSESLVSLLMIIFAGSELFLFFLFRFSNGLTKGILKEKFFYLVSVNFTNNRYSGRVKNPF